MSYLKDFLTQIHNRDFHKFLILWEEYCASDTVEVEEFSQLLKAIKASEMSKPFGQIVESALPLWQTIENEKDSYEILSLLIDLQTTNSPALVHLIQETLKKHHGNDAKYEDKFKLAGLRDAENYQGAIAKYDLLNHMQKGKTVFHTGGWGTGEIIDVSLIREHLVIDFENVSGRKDLSFANAFKTIVPLPDTHFLARRFTDPDKLEKEGRADPVGLVKMFLHDIGPKSAAEIKDELCELVIPEKDWAKWWQGARAKLKKDPMVETPETLKDPFYLRKAEISHDDQLKHIVNDKQSTNEFIQNIYSFLRDTTGALKNPETKNLLQNKLLELSDNSSLSNPQLLQVYFLLEQFFNYKSPENPIAQIILQTHDFEKLINDIETLAFKKRAIVAIGENHRDWSKIYLNLLSGISQAQLRDYLLQKLNVPEHKAILEDFLENLLHHPQKSPDLFVWYFQKLIGEKDSIPFKTEEGKHQFFEAFFVLIHSIEGKTDQRDLLKKMYNLLSAKRYALVRQLLQNTTLEYVKEFLLLVSKCQSFSDHDIQILRSLAEVVHPQLSTSKSKKNQKDDDRIWTTEAGYLKVQERLQQIGTVEIVDNAREIEAARALGDLRENSEFKFAQERRARLQGELKTLSDQLKLARILTPEDINSKEVGIGAVVEAKNAAGKTLSFTILGPWDADPDQNILSYNSKLAKSMEGKKVGDSVDYKDENYTITEIGRFL